MAYNKHRYVLLTNSYFIIIIIIIYDVVVTIFPLKAIRKKSDRSGTARVCLCAFTPLPATDGAIGLHRRRPVHCHTRTTVKGKTHTLAQSF